MLERLPLFLEKAQEARAIAKRQQQLSNESRRRSYEHAQTVTDFIEQAKAYEEKQAELLSLLPSLNQTINEKHISLEPIIGSIAALELEIDASREKAIKYNASENWQASTSELAKIKTLTTQLQTLLTQKQSINEELSQSKQSLVHNNAEVAKITTQIQQLEISTNRAAELNQYWAEMSVKQRSAMDEFNLKAEALEGKIIELKHCGDTHSEADLNQAQKIAKDYEGDDPVHNAAIRYLLDTRYRQDFPDFTNISGAAFWIRNQQIMDDFEEELPDSPDGHYKWVNQSFIRDAFQLYTHQSLNISNLLISDEIADSSFQKDFDRLICGVNLHSERLNKTTVGTFKHVAHRDAIQIIPENDRNIPTQSRFLGARIREPIRIENNIIRSAAALQGIFATDGAFDDLHIKNNQIQTGGEHTISICGMLGGSIKGNSDLKGQLLNTIKILPLRLGGGANCHVLGFHKDCSYEYKPIDGLATSLDKRQTISEHIRNQWGATFYTDFHMDKFIEEYIQLGQHSMEVINMLQKINKEPILTVQVRLAIKNLIAQGWAKMVEPETMTQTQARSETA